MGKLILLQRVREDAAREALVSSSDAVDRARAEERGAEGRRRAAGEALAEAQRVPSGGAAPLARVLHLADLRRRQLQDVFVAMEAHFAKLRDERIAAEQARERLWADWEANRERRKRLEERLRAMRREGWRKRERAAESARDDLPPRGGGDGGVSDD